MEIKGEDGGIISIQSGSRRDCGRGAGFPSDDPTVSRRHVSFHLPDSAAHQHNNRKTQDSETGLHFEALGKNPVWVLDSGSGEIRVFRKSEKGVLRVGDCFCVSANKPVLFTVKKSVESDKVETKMKGSSELENRLNEEDVARDEDLGSGSVDISQIDPLKEFGFLVLGHEFDNYPKTMIRDMKDWDWFLEEQREDSETDDDDDDDDTERSRSKGKKGVRRKKKTEVNDDEWTGESEDEKVAISSFGRGKRPRYNTTRSKDSSKPLRDTRSKAKLKPTKIVRKRKDEEEEDDDDEETLGGFIVVSDEDPEEDEEDEEEEEELEDDEEDNDEDEMEE